MAGSNSVFTTDIDPDLADRDASNGNTRKRKRISKACESCRRRKEKCDGVQPLCNPCRTAQRTCTYPSQSRRRGLAPGYVHGLEALLGLLLETVDGAASKILAVLQGDLEQFVLEVRQRPLQVTESLIGIWRDSLAAKELEKVLDASENSAEDSSPSASQPVDRRLTTLYNAGARASVRETFVDADDRDMELIAADLSAPPDPVFDAAITSGPSQQQFYSATASQQRTDMPGSRLPAATVTAKFRCLPANWPRLLETYTANTHCWLPILKPYALLRSSSLAAQTQRETDCDSLTAGQVASLWSALSYTSSQDRCSDHIPDSMSLESDLASEASMHVFSKTLAVQEQPTYQAENVHALLMTALSHIAQSSWTEAWLLLGRATYIAVDTETHKPSLQNPAEARSDDPNMRLFSGCFILDSLVSWHLGRRPHFQSDDMDVFGSSPTDSLEEWDVWRPSDQRSAIDGAISNRGPGRVLSTFNGFLDLARLINDSLRASCDRIPSLLARFNAWQDCLPIPLQIIRSNCFQPRDETPHVVNFTLATISLYLRLLSSTVGQQHPEPRAQFLDPCCALLINYVSRLPGLRSRFGENWMPPVFVIYVISLDGSLEVFGRNRSCEWEAAKQAVLDEIHHVWADRHPNSTSSIPIPFATIPGLGVADLNRSGPVETLTIQPEPVSDRVASVVQHTNATSTGFEPDVDPGYRIVQDPLSLADSNEHPEVSSASGAPVDTDWFFNTLSNLDALSW